MGRGNQYIQFVRVWYCKLPTNGKQLPALFCTGLLVLSLCQTQILQNVLLLTLDILLFQMFLSAFQQFYNDDDASL